MSSMCGSRSRERDSQNKNKGAKLDNAPKLLISYTGLTIKRFLFWRGLVQLWRSMEIFIYKIINNFETSPKTASFPTVHIISQALLP